MRNTKSRRVQQRWGFSLMEMVVVVGVMSILAATVTPLTLQEIGAARTAKAFKDTQQIHSMVMAFHKDTARFPRQRTAATPYFNGLSADRLLTHEVGSLPTLNNTTEQLLLNHLMNNTPQYPNWRGPYMNTALRDPWDAPYILHVAGYCPNVPVTNVTYYVWAASAGPNQVMETNQTAAAAVNDDIATLLYINQPDAQNANLALCW